MKVFITGGTGSLGRALINRYTSDGHDVLVYSRDEGKQSKLESKKSLTKVIGDIRDYDKVCVAMKRFQPDIVIHAAALKRIEDMEYYPDECIKTNIQGTENVAKAALFNQVKKCILVSTDKACQPVNVYGSSKFIAERLFTNYDFHSSDTIFASISYGNVIASRGSFIPLWFELLSKEREIKITSMEMTRFLFTLEDAVDAVVAATEASEGGEVFVPQIKSYDMRTIVKAMSKLAGREVKYDIIGLRPGEKLHEDMLAKTELPFTYEVEGENLLSIRPQYTNRVHNQNQEKYSGPEFNSSLHVSQDVSKLTELIVRGREEAN